jgi:hypothetical protein
MFPQHALFLLFPLVFLRNIGRTFVHTTVRDSQHLHCFILVLGRPGPQGRQARLMLECGQWVHGSACVAMWMPHRACRPVVGFHHALDILFHHSLTLCNLIIEHLIFLFRPRAAVALMA